MSGTKIETNISFKKVFRVFLNRWYLVIAPIFLCLATAFIYTAFFTTPIYASTAKLFVQHDSDDELSSGDISVSLFLTYDYKELILDRVVLQEVIDNLDLNMSYGTLNSAVTINNPEKTRILEIQVLSYSPDMAKQISDEICIVSKKKIVEIMGIEQVTVLSEGYLSNSPISPNITRNITNGIVVGILFSVLLLLCLTIFNNKINLPEDVESELEIPVLAVIPFNNAKKQYKSK